MPLHPDLDRITDRILAGAFRQIWETHEQMRLPLRIPAWIPIVLWIGFQMLMFAAGGEDQGEQQQGEQGPQGQSWRHARGGWRWCPGR